MYKITNFFALLICGISVCFAARVKEPTWVSVPKKVYNPEKYLSYVGKAKDKSQAELLAVEGIASVFEQDVASASVSSSRMEQASNEGKVAIAKSQNFNSKIMRKVDVDSLVGIEIKEYWTDAEKNIYVIAVLDKPKTSLLYSNMIEKNNAEIKKLLNAKTDDEFSFENYARIDFAREISVLNEKYLSRLSVIDFDKASELEKQTVSASDINAMLLQIAKQIPVYVYFQNDSDGRVRSAYAKMLNSFGFRTSQERNERYSFTGSMSFEQNIPKDKSSVQCRYTFKADLKDSAFAQNLFTLSFDGRNSSNSYSDAQNRALRAIEARAAGNSTEEFRKFLQNIVVHY